MNSTETDYLKGGKQARAGGSLLSSSSRYLNSAKLRDLYAQEGLRRNGREIPPAFLVPDAIAAFEELKDQDGVRRLLVEEKAAHPGLARWLDARFVSSIKAADVAGCSAGTLGASVHAFITQSGMQMDFMFLQPPRDDYEYLQKRLAQNHDTEHMVTGFGTDPVGETALMCCNVASWMHYFGPEFAAEMSRFNVYLSSTNLMRTVLHYPKVMPAFLDGVQAGLQMGAALRAPLFLVRWEDHFDSQVADIRKELNIQGSPPPGAWEWTLDAWLDAV